MRKLFTLFVLLAAFVAGRLNAQTYEVVETITVQHDELEKTTYSGNTETFDINAVKTALNVTDLSTCKAYIVNCTTGEFVLNSTDGWRDANGDAANWGTTAGVCVKIQNIPNGSYTLGTTDSGIVNYIGCIDASHSAGEVYHAKWGIVNESNQAVIIDVVITFVAPDTYKPTIVQTINLEYEATEKRSGAFTENLAISADDLAAVKTALGVEDWSTCSTWIVNCTDGNFRENTTDGWRDGGGDAAGWGTDAAGICVKLDLPGGRYSYIGAYSDSHVAGEVYHAKWGIVNSSEQAVVLDLAITFVAQPAVERSVVDLGIATSVTYETTVGSYNERVASISDEDVAAICEELGITALSEATVLGYNPTTQSLVTDFAGYDGWRDANGDFHNWSGNQTAPACVKYDNGKDYYCYNIQGLEPQTVKCYWALANEAKAVLVEIDFIYEAPVILINTLADLTAGNKGSQNIQVEQALLNTGVVSNVTIDVNAVATALGCSVSDLKLYAETADGITNSPTALNQGYWLDANGHAVNWGANAAIYFEPDNNGDFSAIHIGQYDGAFTEATTWTGKLYLVNEDGLSYYTLNVTVIINPAEVVYTDNQTTQPEVVGRKASVTLTGRTFYAGWNTFVLPFAFTAEQMMAVTGDDAVQLATMQAATTENIQFQTVDAVPANTPCLLYVSQDVTDEFLFEDVDVTTVEATPTTVGESFNFVGSYVATTVAEGNYILGSDNTFKKAAGGNALGAFRAYLTRKVSAGEVKEVMHIMLDGTTAIDRIDGVNVQEAGWYNLGGLRMGQPQQKGIYVKDGKKVVIK